MTDTETCLQEIKDKVNRFQAERGWTKFHSPKNLAMSIGIEAAELMEILQWISTEDAYTIDESAEFEHLQEELADVMIYCMSLANILNIDVAAAIADKLHKNTLRWPVPAQSS